MKINEIIREKRKALSLTQEQIADFLGVSTPAVRKWEKGRNMPDISLLVKIAEFFDVSILEIISGERKSERMEKEVKEAAEAMSDYVTAEYESHCGFMLCGNSSVHNSGYCCICLGFL